MTIESNDELGNSPTESSSADNEDRTLSRAEECFRRLVMSKGLPDESIEDIVSSWLQSPADILVTVNMLETFDEIIALHPERSNLLPPWFVPR